MAAACMWDSPFQHLAWLTALFYTESSQGGPSVPGVEQACRGKCWKWAVILFIYFKHLPWKHAVPSSVFKLCQLSVSLCRFISKFDSQKCSRLADNHWPACKSFGQRSSTVNGFKTACALFCLGKHASNYRRFYWEQTSWKKIQKQCEYKSSMDQECC